MAAESSSPERVEGEMVRLRLRLRLAAMKRPSEEVLVAVLWKQADMANAALAAVEAFRASMRWCQAAGGRRHRASSGGRGSIGIGRRRHDDVIISSTVSSAPSIASSFTLFLLVIVSAFMHVINRLKISYILFA